MESVSFVALIAVCSFIVGVMMGAWGLAKFVNDIRKSS